MLRPLGLTEKKLVPDPIFFTEPDPLGAMVHTTTNHNRALVPKGIALDGYCMASMNKKASLTVEWILVIY